METAAFIVSIISVAIAGLGLIVSVIVNYKSAKLSNEAQVLELRRLIVDANDSILELGKTNDKLAKARIAANIEKLLNAYEVICYIQRKKIESEEFRIMYGNEMKQITDTEAVRKRLNINSNAYPYIKKALGILQSS